MEPSSFSYESMGTSWNISVWDPIGADALGSVRDEVTAASAAFDGAFSRFKPESVIAHLSSRTGVQEVPEDLVAMLRIYEKLWDASQGACTPLIGVTLSDLGYDQEYSLTAKSGVRHPPDLRQALRIVDDRHLELMEPVLIDLGAVGKGFFVDRIASLLDERGIRRFLVDGSGDIFYRGAGEPIRAGMEDPEDPSNVIGVLEITDGALCASSGSRRRWGGRHHIVDPRTLASPTGITATWVLAESAAVADGLATALFLAEPEAYRGLSPFEYCIMNDEHRVKRSPGFAAELF